MPDLLPGGGHVVSMNPRGARTAGFLRDTTTAALARRRARRQRLRGQARQHPRQEAERGQPR